MKRDGGDAAADLLEEVRDQRDAIARELADLRRLGRAQVDRLQERVDALLKERESGVAYQLLHAAFKHREAEMPSLGTAPGWYVEARKLFPRIVDPIPLRGSEVDE